jgi:hypothetical protein
VPAPTDKRARNGRLWIEKTLPFVDDETAAMAMASLLTYLRQPNIYMMLIMPLFFGILFLFGFAQSASKNAGPLAPALVTIWPVFNFGLILLNLFGIDREGFRTLVLLPTDRQKFLLGKNLALMPLVVGVSLIFVVIGSIMAHFSLLVFLLSLLQVIQLYLLYCIAGNFTSLYFPYRMAWQGLRSVGNRSMTFAATLLALVLIVALSAPTVFFVFLDSLLQRYFGYNGFSISLPASALFLCAVVFAYRRGLRMAGAKMMVREQHMLDQLVRDRE